MRYIAQLSWHFRDLILKWLYSLACKSAGSSICGSVSSVGPQLL